MMNSVTFGAIGIVLLMLVWACSRRHSSAAIRPGAMPDAPGYSIQLPPHDLLGRCFSEDDFDFVAGLGSRAVARLLFQERRRLVLNWLRLTRREAQRLFGLHVRTVRFAADLRPAVELRLLAQAGAFLLTYELLAVLVWFHGPFRARAYARSIRGLGSLLSALGGAIAQTVALARVPRIDAVQGD